MRYTLKDSPMRTAVYLYQTNPDKPVSDHIATFYGDDAKTNATKVLNLLNETANSQGKPFGKI